MRQSIWASLSLTAVLSTDEIFSLLLKMFPFSCFNCSSAFRPAIQKGRVGVVVLVLGAFWSWFWSLFGFFSGRSRFLVFQAGRFSLTNVFAWCSAPPSHRSKRTPPRAMAAPRPKSSAPISRAPNATGQPIGVARWWSNLRANQKHLHHYR